MTEEVKQVGGSHYAAPLGWGHWDIMETYDVDYLAGNATAYIARYDRKGTPREDLEKAKSYLEKMLYHMRGARRLVPFQVMQEFYKVNSQDANKRRLHNLILVTGTEQDIMTACLTLSVMIAGIVD